MAHAGRRGLLDGVLQQTVQRMRQLGAEKITAWLGPSICGSCYEVPEQMASESESSMPGIRTRTSWGTPSLDLPAAAAASLSALGVRVVTDPRCTLEDQALFSYRRDSGCGRQALVIVPVLTDTSHLRRGARSAELSLPRAPRGMRVFPYWCPPRDAPSALQRATVKRL